MAKYTRQLAQWKAKLSEAEFIELAESSYDATAGEIEVLGSVKDYAQIGLQSLKEFC